MAAGARGSGGGFFSLDPAPFLLLFFLEPLPEGFEGLPESFFFFAYRREGGK